MFKRVATGSILCLVLLVPNAAAHSHHHRHKAKAQIQLQTEEPMGNFGDFGGTIDSSKGSCQNNRKLQVVFRKPGKDKVVGSGHSDSVPTGPSPYDITARTANTGHYYVLAPPTSKCAAAESNAFLINVV